VQNQYYEVTSSITGYSLWGLWWTKQHCDEVLLQYFNIPLSVSIVQWSTLFALSLTWGHTVAQLVEALRYKLEGRVFDSR
jgi:hypothetical protein